MLAKKWKTLEHSGVLFPPPYKPKGIKILIRGRPADLGALQEEMVYHWAKKKDTPYANDATFRKNFVADFARQMNLNGLQYGEIDFTDAYRLADKEKAAREAMSREARKALAAQRKKVREELKAVYGTARMNGQSVDVGNYMVEPPGLFIGRGNHPLRGRWKRRVTQADVILNLGKDAAVPPGDWKDVVHRRDATWLASWTDGLTDKTKYIWLADTAKVKQDRDKMKYNKAVLLSREIDRIKERMVEDMRSEDPKTASIATACYLIYRTAMRVGDEKDEEEADTVGATTLRKEHIKSISDNEIEFDFLGKDSVRWKETVQVQGHDVQFRNNLKTLLSDKEPREEIFRGITSRHVNAYYSGIVSGLTAKVFRTYLASSAVVAYLATLSNMVSKPGHEKLFHAKMANLEAARMCNHKRTIPKTFKKSLQKRRDRLADLKARKPWERYQESLKKARAAEPKTAKQKAAKQGRVKKLKDMVQKRRGTHREMVKKVKLQIDAATNTRDYNLGTSLRNYIDPRILKFWSDAVDAPMDDAESKKKSLWEQMYTTALQKKFQWVNSERGSWRTISKKYRNKDGDG